MRKDKLCLVRIKFRLQERATGFHFKSDTEQTNKACALKPQNNAVNETGKCCSMDSNYKNITNYKNKCMNRWMESQNHSMSL